MTTDPSESGLDRLESLSGRPGTCIRFDDTESFGDVAGRLGSSDSWEWGWSRFYFAPFGLYGYLLTDDYVEVLRSRKYTYAEGEDRPFVHVFVASMGDILDVSEYDDVRYVRDFKKILGRMDKDVRWEIEFRYGQIRGNAFSMFMELTRKVSDGGRELTSLLKDLGYSGVVDSTGAMASDSPPQLVTFVRPKHLFTMSNPLGEP